MKKITALASAGLLAAAVSPTLAGCTPTTEQASTVTTSVTPTIWTGAQAPAHRDESGEGFEAPTPGSNLNQYIVDNKIAEVPFKPDEPGTPTIDFPLPPDWRAAGDMKPDWAYGAIVYAKPVDPNDPPYMYAIASKLTGNVDAQKVLDLAPGQLNELPQFKSIDGGPERSKFADFDSVNYVGTYVWDGNTRAVGQQTIVIPGKDGLFVLQLNAEAPKGQEKVLIDAIDLIRAQTKITVPS